VNHPTQRRKIVLLLVLIAIGPVIGFYVPAFYEWSGSEQRRIAPIVGQAFAGLVLVTLTVCATLPWINLDTSQPTKTDTASRRFQLRTILIATGCVAILFGALRWFPTTASVVVWLLMAGVFVREIVHRTGGRLILIGLLATAYGPYLWFIIPNRLSQSSIEMSEMLCMVLGLPAILPSMLAARFIQQHPSEMIWLPVLITSIELAAGLLMIRFGPKRTIAYCMLVLLVSTFGSFALDALMRI
jgi:hypothetical protein